MRNSRFELPRNPVARYILVGGLSYGIELTTIFLLRLAGIGELLSVGIAFWVGLAISFLLQKLVAFENRERKARRVAYQGLSYAALVALNYCFTLVFVGIASPLLGLYISRTIALGTTTVWNYFIYSRIIFNRHD